VIETRASGSGRPGQLWYHGCADFGCGGDVIRISGRRCLARHTYRVMPDRSRPELSLRRAPRRDTPDGASASCLDAGDRQLMDTAVKLLRARCDSSQGTAATHCVSIRTALPGLSDRHAGQFMAINASPKVRRGARNDFETVSCMRGADPARRRYQDRRQLRLRQGVAKLDGATVMATDLRASASLLMGPGAQGET